MVKTGVLSDSESIILSKDSHGIDPDTEKEKRVTTLTMTFTNISQTDQKDFSLKIKKGSEIDSHFYVKDYRIPQGDTVTINDRILLSETGDNITQFQSDQVNVEYTISYGLY